MAIIDKPSDYFNTVLYSGTGSTQSITGVGFQPDLIWGKNRSATGSHNLVDSVRGVSEVIYSNLTDAEATDTSSYNAFGSDGFTMGSQSNINGSGNNIVSWNWKAGGTASSNTDGSITSSVSASTTSGFSIVSYTGTGNDPETIGHGLGVTPSMIIVKDRNTAGGWRVYHKSVGNDKVLALDGTIAGTTSDAWNSTTPTPSLFTVGNDTITNGNGTTHIAYCFAEKQGYSKFGSYTGNGSADGTFIYTGFKPAWVMTKKTSGTSSWIMMDNKRNTSNVMNKFLDAYDGGAEGSLDSFDFLSNGFKLRTSNGDRNASGETYIFMCFAENPFTTSTGVPATAR